MLLYYLENQSEASTCKIALLLPSWKIPLIPTSYTSLFWWWNFHEFCISLLCCEKLISFGAFLRKYFTTKINQYIQYRLDTYNTIAISSNRFISTVAGTVITSKCINTYLTTSSIVQHTLISIYSIVVLWMHCILLSYQHKFSGHSSDGIQEYSNKSMIHQY